MAQQKRKRRRRRHSPAAKLFAVLAVIAVMSAVFITLSVTVLFNIEKITVSGETRYTNQEIIDASGILKGTNMHLIDSKLSQDMVCTKLPYIGEAKIIRKYPDTINIKVSECQADSVYKTPKGYVLASGSKVVDEVNKRPEKLPLVTAKLKTCIVGKDIELANGMNDSIERVLAAIEKSKIKGVTAINVENISDIKVTCDEKIVLELGTTESIDKKFNNAVKIISTQRKKYGDEVEGYVNLKYLTSDANRSYFTRGSISDDEEKASSEEQAVE